jgi:hypothetical protein
MALPVICYTKNMLRRDGLYLVVACLLLVAGCVVAPAPSTPSAPVLPVAQSENLTVKKAWPVINAFSAGSDNITPGENVTLQWDTAGSDTVTVTPGVGRVGVRGSVIVVPQETTKYELIASNDKGRSSGWVTVNVRSRASFLPDLVITGISYNSGLLYYTIKNVGSADAGPTNTWLWDMSHMQRDQSWVDGLKPGEEKKRGFSNFNYDGNEITICADGGNDIKEASRDNNCYTPSWGFKYNYDMQQYASRANWRGTGGIAKYGDLYDPVTGQVNKVNEIALEDGKVYRNVIEMTPPSESYAWLEGLFGENIEQWQLGSYMVPMTLPVNARFVAKVGLPKSAERSQGVTFIFGLIDAEGKRYNWPGVKATYDGKLDDINIDLTAYGGKRILAILRLEAGADAENNDAVWAEARITQ